MSTFQQFFPGGGSSSGGGGNVGGGTTPVEIIGVSGGGGAGGEFKYTTCVPDNCFVCGCTQTNHTPNPGAKCFVGCYYGGTGGNGAVFYADNYFVSPGTTYPITIGAGGAAGTPSCLEMTRPACIILSGSAAGCPASFPDFPDCLTPITHPGATQGSNGGATSFNNPCCKLYVDGGGGGGGARHASLTNAPNMDDICGRDGGTGGGGAGVSCIPACVCIPYPNIAQVTKCIDGLTCYNVRGCGGKGKYYNKLQGACNISSAETLKKPYGWLGGFPAMEQPACHQDNNNGYIGAVCSVVQCQSQPDAISCQWAQGGGQINNIWPVCEYGAGCYCGSGSPGPTNPFKPASQIYSESINGVYDCLNYEFTWGDNYVRLGTFTRCCKCVGAGGMSAPMNNAIQESCVHNGCPGGLWIRYPDEYAAASSFPGGTDLSPTTPGYRTYCFDTSGSITI